MILHYQKTFLSKNVLIKGLINIFALNKFSASRFLSLNYLNSYIKE